MNEQDKELWNEAAKATEGAGDSWDAQVAFLQKFADLIRADEREAILKLADSLGWIDVDRIKARGGE